MWYLALAAAAADTSFKFDLGAISKAVLFCFIFGYVEIFFHCIFDKEMRRGENGIHATMSGRCRRIRRLLVKANG